MKNILPKSVLGKLSILFIFLAPLLFFLGTSVVISLYEGVSSGDTICEDLVGRPLLAGTMVLGNLVGVLSFIFGLVAILKKKDRSGILYVATILGGLFTVFLILQLTSVY